MRIPTYSTSEKARRPEFRSPDPSCNPCYAFSAMLMAGLDGIANKVEPSKPLDKNLYDLEPEETAKVESLPGSLDESLDALERDNAFLFKGDVFTKNVIETWLDYKRANEVEPMRLRPHPYEFALHYDIQPTTLPLPRPCQRQSPCLTFTLIQGRRREKLYGPVQVRMAPEQHQDVARP